MARPSNQEKSQPPTGTAAPSATSSSKLGTTVILLATGHTDKQNTERHSVRCAPDQAATDSPDRVAAPASAADDPLGRNTISGRVIAVGHLRCSPHRKGSLRYRRAPRSGRHRGTPNLRAGHRAI